MSYVVLQSNGVEIIENMRLYKQTFLKQNYKGVKIILYNKFCGRYFTSVLKKYKIFYTNTGSCVS